MAVFANKEEFTTTMDRMVAALAADETFKQRASWVSMSVGFDLSDLEAQYTLMIDKGVVSGQSTGAGQARLGVTVSSETFDKMLSNRLDVESAYFRGEIKLRGGEYLGEQAAQYLHYFAKAYAAARSGDTN